MRQTTDILVQQQQQWKKIFTDEMKRIFSIQTSMLLQKRIELNEQIKWSDILHYYLVWCANIQRDSDILFYSESIDVLWCVVVVDFVLQITDIIPTLSTSLAHSIYLTEFTFFSSAIFGSLPLSNQKFQTKQIYWCTKHSKDVWIQQYAVGVQVPFDINTSAFCCRRRHRRRR